MTRLREVLFILFPSAVFAQASAISSVVNAATGEARLSPGGRAVVRLGYISSELQPWTVKVGGLDAPLVGEDDDGYWVIQIPFELPIGPTTVTANLGNVSTPPFGITLEPFSPGVLNFQRPDSPLVWLECSAPDRHAKPGVVLTALAVGLGPSEPPSIASSSTLLPPPLPTVAKPRITVAGREAEILSSVHAYRGEYRVTFRIPPETPLGFQSVVISIGDYRGSQGLPVTPAMLHRQNVFGGQSYATPGSVVASYACGGFFSNAGPPGLFGDTRNPPVELGGTTVTVKDSAGTERRAPLLFVGRVQVNYIVPVGTASGPATVTTTSIEGAVSGRLEIRPAVPRLYAGRSGAPAAAVLRVRNGVLAIEPVERISASGQPEIAPIDMGPDTDELYLLLFGTGFRGRSSLDNVRLVIGNIAAPVTYAGPQGENGEIDQLNVRLPRALAGHGNFLDVTLTIDGWRAFGGRLHFP